MTCDLDFVETKGVCISGLCCNASAVFRPGMLEFNLHEVFFCWNGRQRVLSFYPFPSFRLRILLDKNVSSNLPSPHKSLTLHEIVRLCSAPE